MVFVRPGQQNVPLDAGVVLRELRRVFGVPRREQADTDGPLDDIQGPAPHLIAGHQPGTSRFDGAIIERIPPTRPATASTGGRDTGTPRGRPGAIAVVGAVAGFAGSGLLL